jgi:hypothetical protein
MNQVRGAVLLLVLLGGCHRLDRPREVPVGSLSGTLFDTVDGRRVSLPYGRVRVEPSSRTTVGNADGSFVVRDMPVGLWTTRSVVDDNGDGSPESGALVGARVLPVGDRVGATLLGDVVLVPTTIVRGNVLDGEGARVAAVRIDEDGNHFVEATTTAGIGGVFELPRLISGAPVEIMAIAPDGVRATAFYSRTLDVPSPGQTAVVTVNDMEFQPGEPGPVSLRLATPVEGRVDVTVRDARQPRRLQQLQVVSTQAGQVVNFDITGMGFGPFDVEVRAGSLRGVQLPVVALPPVADVSQANTWGPMILSDECRRDAYPAGRQRDCDDDGVAGLPFVGPDEPDADVWNACGATCGGLTGAALVTATCVVSSNPYDCDDDGDGQSDVTEPAICAGAGTDLDGDGLCGSADLFPQCAANDARDDDCQPGAPFVLPPVIDFSDVGEGEGEGEEGEGEGEGETRDPPRFVFVTGSPNIALGDYTRAGNVDITAWNAQGRQGISYSIDGSSLSLSTNNEAFLVRVDAQNETSNDVIIVVNAAFADVQPSPAIGSGAVTFFGVPEGTDSTHPAIQAMAVLADDLQDDDATWVLLHGHVDVREHHLTLRNVVEAGGDLAGDGSLTVGGAADTDVVNVGPFTFGGTCVLNQVALGSVVWGGVAVDCNTTSVLGRLEVNAASRWITNTLQASGDIEVREDGVLQAHDVLGAWTLGQDNLEREMMFPIVLSDMNAKLEVSGMLDRSVVGEGAVVVGSTADGLTVKIPSHIVGDIEPSDEEVGAVRVGTLRMGGTSTLLLEGRPNANDPSQASYAWLVADRVQGNSLTRITDINPQADPMLPNLGGLVVKRSISTNVNDSPINVNVRKVVARNGPVNIRAALDVETFVADATTDLAESTGAIGTAQGRGSLSLDNSAVSIGTCVFPLRVTPVEECGVRAQPLFVATVNSTPMLIDDVAFTISAWDARGLPVADLSEIVVDNDSLTVNSNASMLIRLEANDYTTPDVIVAHRSSIVATAATAVDDTAQPVTYFGVPQGALGHPAVPTNLQLSGDITLPKSTWVVLAGDVDVQSDAKLRLTNLIVRDAAITVADTASLELGDDAEIVEIGPFEFDGTCLLRGEIVPTRVNCINIDSANCAGVRCAFSVSGDVSPSGEANLSAQSLQPTAVMQLNDGAVMQVDDVLGAWDGARELVEPLSLLANARLIVTSLLDRSVQGGTVLVPEDQAVHVPGRLPLGADPDGVQPPQGVVRIGHITFEDSATLFLDGNASTGLLSGIEVGTIVGPTTAKISGDVDNNDATQNLGGIILTGRSDDGAMGRGPAIDVALMRTRTGAQVSIGAPSFSVGTLDVDADTQLSVVDGVINKLEGSARLEVFGSLTVGSCVLPFTVSPPSTCPLPIVTIQVNDGYRLTPDRLGSDVNGFASINSGAAAIENGVIKVRVLEEFVVTVTTLSGSRRDIVIRPTLATSVVRVIAGASTGQRGRNFDDMFPMLAAPSLTVLQAPSDFGVTSQGVTYQPGPNTFDPIQVFVGDVSLLSGSFRMTMVAVNNGYAWTGAGDGDWLAPPPTDDAQSVDPGENNRVMIVQEFEGQPMPTGDIVAREVFVGFPGFRTDLTANVIIRNTSMFPGRGLEVRDGRLVGNLMVTGLLPTQLTGRVVGRVFVGQDSRLTVGGTTEIDDLSLVSSSSVVIGGNGNAILTINNTIDGPSDRIAVVNGSCTVAGIVCGQ